MTSVIFTFACAMLILSCYKITHHIINVVSVFAAPYMLIIPINNLFMVKEGFYAISENTMLMVFSGLFCIFIGTIIASSTQKIYKSKKKNSGILFANLFQYYDLTRMLRYVYFVELIVLFRVLHILATRGISFIITPEFEGWIMRGPIGHLLLTIYSIVPILFYYWLNNKKKKEYLFAFILCCAFIFLSLVKYHIVGIIVVTFLFVSLEDKKYVRKGLAWVSVFALGFFVFNYIFIFALRGVIKNVDNSFFWRHTWNYMAGSLIHDDWVFTTGTNVGMSSIYKILRAVLTPFNSLSVALFGIEMSPIDPIKNVVGYVALGSNGEVGNVLDTFGYFFPSKGNGIEIIFAFFVFIIIGYFFSCIYNNSIKQHGKFKIGLSVFLTFFCFFSFFGSFYNLLPAWELLVWSFLFPKFFDRRIKIHWRR